MSALPEHVMTPQEYLEFERKSVEKHEYIGGKIYDFAGASRNHNRITLNTAASLHQQLRGRPGEVYTSDMRVKVPREKMYTYPDVVVVCGTPQLEDKEQDTLLNPILIVEVLSPSTESYDRDKKFRHYRSLPSLREYLLIAQDHCHIEHYARQDDNRWLLTEITQMDGVLALPSIDCTLKLADVYDRVELEETND